MELFLSDMINKLDIDLTNLMVMRHRPYEPELRKVLPWLASEKPEVFNAYQQTQGTRVEAAMAKLSNTGYIASFFGHEPGKAVFVGLYKIGDIKPLTYDQFWSIPAYQTMREYGLVGFKKEAEHETKLWFDLELLEETSVWKGRLVIDWPGLERSWWRRAHRNRFRIEEIYAENTLVKRMPFWQEINLTWMDLKVLPKSWKQALSQWRGIYYIFSEKARKGYVGSAYGEDNICGRWQNYARTGHGDNKHLKSMDPVEFKFSILQRVSPDMPKDEVIRLESSWKERLHTRYPIGLNDN